MVGILAKAQEKYPVQVHAAVAARNHYHLILTPDDLEQLADFMDYVQPPVMWRGEPRPKAEAGIGGGYCT